MTAAVANRMTAMIKTGTIRVAVGGAAVCNGFDRYNVRCR